MKQRIHNQKLLNWHRPLETGEWKTAYLRKRADLPRGGRDWLAECAKQEDCCIYCGEHGCLDALFSPLRCVWREINRSDYCVVDEDDDGLEIYENATDYIHKRVDWSVFGRFAFANQLPLPIGLVDGAKEEISQSGGGKRISEVELARLFNGLTHRGSEEWACGDTGPLELEHVRRALTAVGAVRPCGEITLGEKDYLTRLLALFSNYRSRRISAWRATSEDSREVVFSLARHLFCQYPAPAWLAAVWGASSTAQIVEIQRSLKWACWFVCMGGGGSVRRLAKLMGFRITERTVAHLHEAPDHLMPELACMWAEAVGVSGKKRVANWLIRHQGYHIDPTVFPCGKKALEFAQFWLRTVQWFGRYEHELTDEQAAELLEWGWFKFEDSLRMEGAPFSWSGRKPRKCLEEAPAYLQKAFRSLGGEANKRWEAVGVSWDFAETDSGEASKMWRFEELTQSSELWDEGVAMRHCVAKYDGKCSDGTTVVVSLRCDGMRALTIELIGNGLTLGQVKGRFNREATAVETQVIQRWVNAVVRECSKVSRVRGRRCGV